MKSHAVQITSEMWPKQRGLERGSACHGAVLAAYMGAHRKAMKDGDGVWQ